MPGRQQQKQHQKSARAVAAAAAARTREGVCGAVCVCVGCVGGLTLVGDAAVCGLGDVPDGRRELGLEQPNPPLGNRIAPVTATFHRHNVRIRACPTAREGWHSAAKYTRNEKRPGEINVKNRYGEVGIRRDEGGPEDGIFKKHTRTWISTQQPWAAHRAHHMRRVLGGGRPKIT